MNWATRKLTINEITEAKKVYGNKIDYSNIFIFKKKYIFIQAKSYVMSPNGNIYWPDAPEDFVTYKNGLYIDTFIHEMMHVYQHQKGVLVLWHGLILQALKFLTFTLYNPYLFKYNIHRPFSDYNIEQQGNIAVGIYRGHYQNTINY